MEDSCPTVSCDVNGVTRGEFVRHEESADFLKNLYAIGKSSASSSAAGGGKGGGLPRFQNPFKKSSNSDVDLKWVQLRHRRLLNVGGTPPAVDANPTLLQQRRQSGTNDEGILEGLERWQSPPTIPPMVSEPIPPWVLRLGLPKLFETTVPVYCPDGEGALAQDASRPTAGWPAWILSMLPDRGLKVEEPENAPKDASEHASTASSSRCPVPSVEEVQFTIFTPSSPPNHVLINEYRYPDGHILPHTDGPAYEPLVAIVSLQSSVILRFHWRPPAMSSGSSAASAANAQLGLQDFPLRVDVLLEPRSLVVFTGLLYSHYVHEVPEATEDVVDPVYCINYDLVASSLPDWNGEEEAAAATPGTTTGGTAVFKRKKVSHRGNLRTSVTYRRVWNVV